MSAYLSKYAYLAFCNDCGELLASTVITAEKAKRLATALVGATICPGPPVKRRHAVESIVVREFRVVPADETIERMKAMVAERPKP